MRRICVLFCLALCICSLLAGQKASSKRKLVLPDSPYSFMGLVPGESKEDAVSAIAELTYGTQLGSLQHYEAPICRSNYPGLSGPGLEICVFTGLNSDQSYTLDIVDGKVASITYTFSRDAFSAMIESITEKYGSFKSKGSRTLQNAFGATLNCAVYTWSNTLSKMTAKEFNTANMNKSNVLIEDVKLQAEFVHRTLSNGPKI
jgi:hypothetical protein